MFLLTGWRKKKHPRTAHPLPLASILAGLSQALQRLPAHPMQGLGVMLVEIL